MQKSFMEKQDLARSAFSDRDTFTEEAVVFESDIHIHPGSIIRNTSAEEDHNSRYNIRIVILLLVLTLAIIALLFRYVCYFGLLDIILKWRYIIVYIHNQDGLKKKYLSFHM